MKNQPSNHQKIKVLHIVLSLDPGGMENGVVNVANRLDPEQFEVSICCLTRAGDFAKRLQPWVTVHVLGKKEGFDPALILRLRALLKSCSPDVLHTHNLGPLIYAALANAFLPGKILQGEHAQLPEAEKQGKRLLQRKLFYKLCARVHTVSGSLEQELLEFGLAKGKSAVVVNGVDTARFHPAEAGIRQELRSSLGLGEQTLVMGIVGRFGRYKRHGDLITAFEPLAREHPDFRLLIVGGHGPEEERVKAAVDRSPVRDQILLAGYQQDVRPYYQVMDVLAVPSENEGLSNAVLEALATGVPVLAHTACGNAEVLVDGKTGFVEDLGSIEKLRDKLSQIVQHKQELPTIGQQARAAAVETFGIESMVQGYAELYAKLSRATEAATGGGQASAEILNVSEQKSGGTF